MGHSKISQNFSGIALTGSVLKPKEMARIIKKYQITILVNFASYLSVKSEIDPQGAFQTNLLGLKNTLDLAKEFSLKIFWPSSIAVFGPTTPKDNTSQQTILSQPP